jgi:hypothetical protein
VHARESEEIAAARSPIARRLRMVQDLLVGKPIDASELGYEMNAMHLAALACGPDRKQPSARCPLLSIAGC